MQMHKHAFGFKLSCIRIASLWT